MARKKVPQSARLSAGGGVQSLFGQCPNGGGRQPIRVFPKGVKTAWKMLLIKLTFIDDAEFDVVAVTPLPSNGRK